MSLPAAGDVGWHRHEESSVADVGAVVAEGGTHLEANWTKPPRSGCCGNRVTRRSMPSRHSITRKMARTGTECLGVTGRFGTVKDAGRLGERSKMERKRVVSKRADCIGRKSRAAC